MRTLFLLIAVVFVVAAVYFFPPQSNAPPDPASFESQGKEQTSSIADDGPHHIALPHKRQLSLPEANRPKEMIGSIYDHGLSFREEAIRVVGDLLQNYDPVSYTRYAAITIDSTAFLSNNYLEQDSFPKVLSITPFPDTSFVVDQDSYTVMNHIQSAMWEGTIRGTDSGKVEIAVVRGDKNPGLVIRIFNGSQQISVFETDVRHVYVALEGNPFRGQSLD